MIRPVLDGGAKIDVAIIGGGPAGLAAATALKRRGIGRVVVLEREAEAGGIPRHCGHFGFGMREFKRVLTGPKYAKKLVATALAARVEIHTSTTVVEARPNGNLLLTSNDGANEITARRIIYATGVREAPRAARLISGTRPLGVMNTGALQSMVYLKHRKPFKRPVIVGTELVSFSAIMTCKHAKIRPVAMLEESGSITARWPSQLYPRLAGIALYRHARLAAIEGERQVSGVVIEEAGGAKRRIDCDGVILTGRFTPEASLARCGHLSVDPQSGGPVVDQYGRCSDPAYFATGNLLRPVETAPWSWTEGRLVGQWVANDLAGTLPAQVAELDICTSGPLLKYAMPQKIMLPLKSCGMENLQLRFSRNAKGELVVRSSKGVVFRKTLRVHPERRVLLPIKKLVSGMETGRMEITFEEARI